MINNNLSTKLPLKPEKMYENLSSENENGATLSLNSKYADQFNEDYIIDALQDIEVHNIEQISRNNADTIDYKDLNDVTNSLND